MTRKHFLINTPPLAGGKRKRAHRHVGKRARREVCVWRERERARGRETERQRDRDRASEGEREGGREREREIEDTHK